MTKTFNTCLVLLILLLLQRVEAQSPQPERPNGTTAPQKPPAGDPLGRSTPHGTVVGLVTAAEQENLDRAGEYLESGLKPPERRELARMLWVVLDRKLLTSLDRVSDRWTEISTMGSPAAIGSVLSKARPAMSRWFWTECRKVKATHLVILCQHVAGDPPAL